MHLAFLLKAHQKWSQWHHDNGPKHIASAVKAYLGRSDGLASPESQCQHYWIMEKNKRNCRNIPEYYLKKLQNSLPRRERLFRRIKVVISKTDFQLVTTLFHWFLNDLFAINIVKYMNSLNGNLLVLYTERCENFQQWHTLILFNVNICSIHRKYVESWKV